MGYKTDLRSRAQVFRFYDEARQAFAEVQQQTEFALQALPTNRELTMLARRRAFGTAA